MNRGVSYEFDGFRFHPSTRRLERNGTPVAITAKGSDCLTILIEHAGEVCSKDDLFARLWPDAEVEENSLAQLIAAIRRALGEKAGENRFIATVPGRGYSFVAPLRVPAPQADAQPARRSRKPLLIVLAAALLAAGAGLALRVRPGPPSAFRTVPVTTMAGVELTPTFSPDGSQIAFSARSRDEDPWQIHVKVIGEEKSVPITSGAGGFSPVWSPDGRWIACFTAGPADARHILLVPPLGGEPRRLATLRWGGGFLAMAWTEDSRHLILPERRSNDAPSRLVAVSIDSGEYWPITNPPPKSFGDSTPAVSADGRSLAFLRSMTAGAPQIHVMPLGAVPRGGEPRPITPFGAPSLTNLMWSRDGRHILYLTGFIVSPRLTRIPAAGGSPEHITHLGQLGGGLSMSRQGTRIAYSNYLLDTDVWRLELTGGAGLTPRRLISSSTWDYEPQISPDGKTVAFASGRNGPQEIWLAGASDGEGVRQITHVNGPITGTPRWSPDGTRIAFDARVDGNGDIYTVAIDSGKLTRITSDKATDHIPSWSRDGKWIYYSSQRDGGFRVWRARVDAPAEPHQTVTNGKGWGGYESPDGKQFYYAADFTNTSLWRLPLAGGAEEKLFDKLAVSHNFAVGRDGIYYSEQPSGEYPKGSIWLFDPATRRRRLICIPPVRIHTGVDVSPDGRFLVFAAIETKGGDILMTEGRF